MKSLPVIVNISFEHSPCTIHWNLLGRRVLPSRISISSCLAQFLLTEIDYWDENKLVSPSPISIAMTKNAREFPIIRMKCNS
jgi:hypothetical protein